MTVRPPDDAPPSQSPTMTAIGVATPITRASLHAGQRFGHYRIVGKLGHGGMGEVYDAEDLDSGRRMAIKLMGRSLASPAHRARFLREGRLAASIDHPNSVYIFGTEELDGIPIIAMELSRGGTLHDLVRAKGPLAPAAAVDAMLQVIDGLEAAAARDILHRDVKPSNCFVDADGRVKVGDYGLSISTTADETMLTNPGTVLGTPAFASPEQLRGQPIDVRSDIYSVGATLFYLLTGRPPFEEKGVVALLAAVLERDAPSVRSFRPDVPPALATTVARCLSRQSSGRFTGYGDLRSALAGLGSIQVQPASLLRRIAANFIDGIPALIAGMVLSARTISVDAGGLTFNNSLTSLEATTWAFLLALTYFVICEGRWGATPGKALLGIRAVGHDQRPPGFARATVRYLVFAVLPGLPALAGMAGFGFGLGVWRISETAEPVLVWDVLAAIASVLLQLALFIPARRRNGFAAVHDLASGTRVVMAQPVTRRLTLAAAAPAVSVAEGRQVGPYIDGQPLCTTTGQSVLAARDPSLGRQVWVRQTPEAPHHSDARRDLVRPSRLRWLNGYRATTDTSEPGWDAFAAVDGRPLSEAIDQHWDWPSIHQWLADLVGELRASAGDGTMPGRLGIAYLWLGSDTRLRWLEFPVGPDAQTSADALNLGAVQHVLASLVRRARRPATMLPLRAAAFVGRLEGQQFQDLDELAAALDDLSSVPHQLSRPRRLGMVTAATLLLLVFQAQAIVVPALLSRGAVRYPEHVLVVRHLLEVATARAGRPTASNPARVDTLERYLAGRHRDLLADRNAWPADLPLVPVAIKRLGEEIVARFPAVSAVELVAAEAELAPYLDARSREAANYASWVFAVIVGLHLAFVFLAVVAVVGLVIALATGSGMLLRIFGVAVVDGTNRKARRWRVLVRTGVLWSPLLLWIPFAMLDRAFIADLTYIRNGILLGVVSAPLLVGAAAWSVWRPARGPADLVAGTYLVPR